MCKVLFKLYVQAFTGSRPVCEIRDGGRRNGRKRQPAANLARKLRRVAQLAHQAHPRAFCAALSPCFPPHVCWQPCVPLSFHEPPSNAIVRFFML